MKLLVFSSQWQALKTFSDDDDRLPKYGYVPPTRSTPKYGPIQQYQPFFGKAPDVGPLHMRVVPCISLH